MSADPFAIPNEARMAPVPADALVAAICSRDFKAVGRLLAPDVRMRAVLPTRYVEAIGDEVATWMKRWFDGAERFEVIAAGSDDVAGRAAVHWRFQVSPHPGTGAPGSYQIEQVAFCGTAAASISSIDLICSGYRPLPPPPCNGLPIRHES